jgi:hypothetical protein
MASIPANSRSGRPLQALITEHSLVCDSETAASASASSASAIRARQGWRARRIWTSVLLLLLVFRCNSLFRCCCSGVVDSRRQTTTVAVWLLPLPSCSCGSAWNSVCSSHSAPRCLFIGQASSTVAALCLQRLFDPGCSAVPGSRSRVRQGAFFDRVRRAEHQREGRPTGAAARVGQEERGSCTVRPAGRGRTATRGMHSPTHCATALLSAQPQRSHRHSSNKRPTHRTLNSTTQQHQPPCAVSHALHARPHGSAPPHFCHQRPLTPAACYRASAAVLLSLCVVRGSV